jgi:arylsulfatase
MTRRELIGGAASAPALLSMQTAPARRPNILLLMADQFRADCLRVAGNPAIDSPNLQRLAGEGVRFTNAYSSTPTCTPARAALLSGLAPWNHGMLRYAQVAERYPVEMPRALRDAGYYTTAIGKLHYHPQRNSHGYHEALLDESGRVESPGFRSDYRTWFASQAPELDPDATGIGWNDFDAKPYALPERLHPTAWTGQTATSWIEGYQRPEPFFLKVSFARPHSPYDPPERFWKRYEGVNLPHAVAAPWAERFAPRSGPGTDIWHGDLGAAQVRRSRQGYYGSITFIDEQIGRILGALAKRGWKDDTLVVFCSDHGDMLGDHHLWRKSYPYESSAKVPFLVRWPRGTVDKRWEGEVDRPIELRDVLPTFLDAAGVEPSHPIDGQSLLPLIAARETRWRPWLDLEHGPCYSPENHWNALTDGSYKYIFQAHDGREQLFRILRDRGR